MPTRPPSSSGLGHHPFKVAARVRIPLGVRRNCVEYISGPVVKSGVHAGLSSRRSRVQVPSGPQQRATRHRKMTSGFSVGQPIPNTGVERQIRCLHGRVAQLAEHTPEKRGVTGSTPVSTTEIALRPEGVPLWIQTSVIGSGSQLCAGPGSSTAAERDQPTRFEARQAPAIRWISVPALRVVTEIPGSLPRLSRVPGRRGHRSCGRYSTSKICIAWSP